jgi:nitrite reductase/ring-hydroxylating ferredoxin subunit
MGLAAPTWFAVLRSEDASAGEVVPVRLPGAELAVWRTAAGGLEAWDDRCPHRGTRLTLGTNTGSEVVCRYHGWRFTAGSARCTFVPAHPTQTPPKNAVVRTYRCVERYGLVWVSMQFGDDLPEIDALEPAAPSFTMRSVTFDADLGRTARALTEVEGAERLATDVLVARLRLGNEPSAVVFVLCAHSAMRTTVHAIVRSAAAGAEGLVLLRAFNERMKSLQRSLRAGAVMVG